MNIATIVEASGTSPMRILSCPATELIAAQGSFVMWPQSEQPIRVPFAWCYSLRIEDIESLLAKVEMQRWAREVLTDPAKANEWAAQEARESFIAEHGQEAWDRLRKEFGVADQTRSQDGDS
jgi:hypothetical protein